MRPVLAQATTEPKHTGKCKTLCLVPPALLVLLPLLVFAQSVKRWAICFFFYTRWLSSKQSSRRKRISTPLVKNRGLFTCWHFHFKFVSTLFVLKQQPVPTTHPATCGGSEVKVGGAARRYLHGPENICRVTGKTNPRTKGRRPRSRNVRVSWRLYCSGRLHPSRDRDHGSGWICRRSSGEAGVGCCCPGPGWR